MTSQDTRHSEPARYEIKYHAGLRPTGITAEAGSAFEFATDTSGYFVVKQDKRGYVRMTVEPADNGVPLDAPRSTIEAG